MRNTVMSTRWNDAVEARLNELSLVTMGLAGMLEGLDHAVDIAKMGGITDKRLDAVMHLANTRQMTPTTVRVLADAGIDTTPWAVVTGEQKMVRADAIVIERAELPEVTTDVPGFGPHYALVKDGPIHESSFTYAYPDAVASSASWHRRTAQAHLALAEYLSAHPPVPPVSDEDVETLAGVLRQVRPGPLESISWDDMARAALATGRVSVRHE